MCLTAVQYTGVHESGHHWTLVSPVLDDLALAVRSGVRALAMSENHVRKVIDSAAVLWSIGLRIWGSEVRILPGAPNLLRSVPDTWVTVYSGDMGNTFGPKGFSIGSSLHVW